MAADILTALYISLKVALFSTFFALILALALAYSVKNLGARAKSMADAILNAPMVVPPTVVGFALLWLLGRKGPVAMALGNAYPPIVFTFAGATLATTIVAFPLIYRSLRASFDQVPQNLIDAAKTLGLSETGLFFRVFLPQAKTGMLAGCLLALARGMGEFGATLMIGGNIPGRTQTLSLAIFEAASSGDDKKALILSLITVVTGIFILFFTQNLIARTVK